jgi:hypothetical protein
MPTTRETVLAALHARLSALPATALRGEVLPERVPAAGLLILRDGESGEPEVTLSPLRYHYQHRAEIEAVVQGASRDTGFDTLSTKARRRSLDVLELTRGQETELPQALKWQMARADEDYDAALVDPVAIGIDHGGRDALLRLVIPEDDGGDAGLGLLAHDLGHLVIVEITQRPDDRRAPWNAARLRALLLVDMGDIGRRDRARSEPTVQRTPRVARVLGMEPVGPSLADRVELDPLHQPPGAEGAGFRGIEEIRLGANERNPCARDRDARASPEDSQNLPKNWGFRLFEKCPADTSRFASRACDHSPRSARRSFISRKR